MKSSSAGPSTEGSAKSTSKAIQLQSPRLSESKQLSISKASVGEATPDTAAQAKQQNVHSNVGAKYLQHKQGAKQREPDNDEDDDFKFKVDAAATTPTSRVESDTGNFGLDAGEGVNEGDEEEDDEEEEQEEDDEEEDDDEYALGESYGSTLSSSLEDFTQHTQQVTHSKEHVVKKSSSTTEAILTARSHTSQASKSQQPGPSGQLPKSRSNESLLSLAESVQSVGQTGVLKKKVHNLAPIQGAAPALNSMYTPPTQNTSSQQCAFCMKRIPLIDYANHAKTCDLRYEECPNKCGMKIIFLKMHQHLKVCSKSQS